MRYKHSVWFFTSPDAARRFCQQFINNDKLICNKLIPAPADVTPLWKTTMWGIDMDEISIEWSESGFTFETDVPKMLSLMVAISSIDPKMDFIYKFASEELGTSVGNYNITCGRVMEEKKVGNPAGFACAIWGLDYSDYALKKRNKSRLNASEITKIAPFVTGDEYEFTDIDNILAQEDS